jgi:hypothetical protein
VRVPYLGFDGSEHVGTLIVATGVASSASAMFERLRALRFPIARIEPISAYGGDDEASMEADNTSAFNCRPITGGGGWSQHAYGRAIDLDPLENPYLSGSVIQPTTAGRFIDRDQRVPGMIHAGDAIVSAFAAAGWSWGGNWSDPTDYQHFQH